MRLESTLRDPTSLQHEHWEKRGKRLQSRSLSSGPFGKPMDCQGKRSSNGLRMLSVKTITVALLALIAAPSVSAQSCISLQGSTQCSAFNASSISTNSDLIGLFPFLSFVSNREQFDQQLSQYVNSSYVQSKYQQLLGCNKVNLANTTDYYARYTTSVICNSIIQNSIKPCGLSGDQRTPLCADSCAQQASTEEEITINPDLCGSPGSNFVDQVRADFTNCALPADSLSGNCIDASLNEKENCGFSNNLPGLCRYCGFNSPNNTDTCCYNSDVTHRCSGVVLPTLAAMPNFYPTVTVTPSATAAPASNSSSGGLSGGAIAGIVIGSVVGAILLAGLIFLCCILVRRRRGSHNGSLNQPSPRRAQPGMGSAGRDMQPVAGGRVARMAALEGSSSDEKGQQSDSEAYGSSPEARGLQPPPTSQRRGSLSSGSAFAALGEDTSPSNQVSSPEGVQSGQSEQLPLFKDYYSSDEIHPGDHVATLWAYQPRAADEFELERGDMLKVVGIWDDGWATGVRISDRAEDYDGKHKLQRDSGVSNGTQRDTTSPTPMGEVKAFPLVCVCLPEHWKKTIEADNGDGSGNPTQPFGNF